MGKLENLHGVNISTSINATVAVLQLGFASGATLLAPAGAAGSSQNAKNGQVAVTIVESATLREGIVQDSKGKIFRDGVSSAKNQSHPADSKSDKKRRKDTEQLVIFDLP